jgi:hypothetical protein
MGFGAAACGAEGGVGTFWPTAGGGTFSRRTAGPCPRGGSWAICGATRDGSALVAAAGTGGTAAGAGFVTGTSAARPGGADVMASAGDAGAGMARRPGGADVMALGVWAGVAAGLPHGALPAGVPALPGATIIGFVRA